MSTFKNIHCKDTADIDSIEAQQMNILGLPLLEHKRLDNGDWYIKYYNGLVWGGTNKTITGVTVPNKYVSIYQNTFDVTLPIPLKDRYSLLNVNVSSIRIGTAASWGSFYGIVDANTLSFRVFDFVERNDETERTYLVYSYLGYYK